MHAPIKYQRYMISILKHGKKAFTFSCGAGCLQGREMVLLGDKTPGKTPWGQGMGICPAKRIPPVSCHVKRELLGYVADDMLGAFFQRFVLR
jgi:hypothetical protein